MSNHLSDYGASTGLAGVGAREGLSFEWREKSYEPGHEGMLSQCKSAARPSLLLARSKYQRRQGVDWSDEANNRRRRLQENPLILIA